MSADNWAACPRCRESAVKAAMESFEAAAAARDKGYGKVPADEFLALVATADRTHAALIAAEDSDGPVTFREDYELGVWGAKLHVIYRGGCSTCGLSVEFRHEQAVEL